MYRDEGGKYQPNTLQYTNRHATGRDVSELLADFKNQKSHKIRKAFAKRSNSKLFRSAVCVVTILDYSFRLEVRQGLNCNNFTTWSVGRDSKESLGDLSLDREEDFYSTSYPEHEVGCERGASSQESENGTGPRFRGMEMKTPRVRNHGHKIDNQSPSVTEGDLLRVLLQGLGGSANQSLGHT